MQMSLTLNMEDDLITKSASYFKKEKQSIDCGTKYTAWKGFSFKMTCGNGCYIL